MPSHVRLFCDSMDWGFPGKHTGVGCHLISPGNLPDPGIKPVSCLHLLNCRGIFFFQCVSFSFLFYSFIFSSWRLITLQYCSGFCHTLTWISHGFTCVPHPEPPSPSHPSGSSQFTSPKGDSLQLSYWGSQNWMHVQSHPSLCDLMECRLPGSVHGIFQTRILEWVAMPSSMGSSRPKDWTHVSWISCVGRQILCHCTTWEAPSKKKKKKFYLFLAVLGLCCCAGFSPAESWVCSVLVVCWPQ